MTKPQALLNRANRALADQTNDAAVIDVAGFIQPVFDVMSLDDRLVTLGFSHTLVVGKEVDIRHGPVPRGEIWTYTEMSLFTGTSAEEWHMSIEYILSGDSAVRRIHLQNIKVGADTVHPASLLRNLESLGAASGGYNSDRPLVLWPGQTLSVESLDNITAGRTVRFDANYRISESPVQRFETNDNDANIVLTLS